MPVNEKWYPAVNKILVQILLVISGAVFFAFAIPGFVFSEGIPLFAWFMYVPVFMIVYRAQFKTVWIWGGLYGIVSYGLYTSWLATFSTAGMIAVGFEYFVFCAVLFLVLKSAEIFCGKYAWIVQWLIFCAYEYIKTLGFTGFSYGVSAYTQWRNIPLIQFSAVTGVWGITALIDFSSALLYRVILDFYDSFSFTNLLKSFKRHGKALCIWAVCLCTVLIYGIVVIGNTSGQTGKYVKVCAVQNNTDPWKGGVDAYERDSKTLINLTKKALEEDKDIQIVVWPETAVVPSIIMQYNRRKDRKRFEIVNSILEYINKQNAVFVIGNFHSVDTGKEYYDDYNSAFVFKPGVNVIPPDPEIYAKVHLVPFTETFPYAALFPHIYKLLLHGDTHMWTAGTKRTVFTHAGISFSVPICFEDTFGNDCRKFVRNGARAFINMSNDAWSKSLACQNQHLSMAVFRSAESRIPTVRSTASGQTCIIDIHGKISAEAEPFSRTYITGYIPVIDQSSPLTLYDRTGDVLGLFFIVASFISLAAGIIWNKKKK
ncbi:MAG: apolipoprotein N-acyltransferase [Treponema sp.]|nr:apolipoprotein N-acyltransferase [Treponema sp.]